MPASEKVELLARATRIRTICRVRHYSFSRPSSVDEGEVTVGVWWFPSENNAEHVQHDITQNTTESEFIRLFDTCEKVPVSTRQSKRYFQVDSISIVTRDTVVHINAVPGTPNSNEGAEKSAG